MTYYELEKMPLDGMTALLKADCDTEEPAAANVMTGSQKRLWDALDGRALTGPELAAELDTSQDTIRQLVIGLRKAGYRIDQRRGRGYYRQDAPPPDAKIP